MACVRGGDSFDPSNSKHTDSPPRRNIYIIIGFFQEEMASSSYIKYDDDPTVKKWLHEFSQLMGTHFEQLGKKSGSIC